MNLATLPQIESAWYGQSFRHFLTGASGTGEDGAWAIIEPGVRYMPNYHVDAVCEHLEGVSSCEIMRLLITMPPRVLKSATSSVAWPAWEWATRPATKLLGSSYDGDMAIDFAVKSRNLIEHPWYRERWGSAFQIVSDQNVKKHYRNDRGGERRAFGVGGSPTGKGGDIVMVDDPLNARDAHAEVKIEGARKWWREVMQSRVDDPSTGRMVVVMQRLNERDLAGWCIENGYVHLNLPMEFDPKHRCIVVPTGWEDPRTEPGELLFPDRFSAEHLERLRASMGSFAYHAQYNQDPLPTDEHAMFPEPAWNRYTTLPQHEDGTLKRPDDALVSWDMTFKGKGTTPGAKRRARGEVDYVVGGLLYRYGADVYVIDVVRGQWSFTETKRQVLAFDERCRDRHPFPPTRHVVEDKANGPAILSELRGVVPLTPFNPDPHGDKVSRAWAVQPVIAETGNVLLPVDEKRHGWVRPLLGEFRSFPTGAHDDQVDMVVQGVLVMRQRRKIRAA